MSKSFENLAAIYAERSAEAARNDIRALKGDKEGRHQEALLFRALANGQRIHASKALMLLRGRIGATDENLASAAAEVEVTSEMLKAMSKLAATERAAPIESSMIQFMKAAYSHSAKLKSVGKKDEAYLVCQICGFISSDGVPDRCPICHAVPQQFSAVE